MKNRKNILTIIKTSTYMILFLLLISSMFIGDKSFDKRLLLAAFKLSADSVPDSLLPFLSKDV